MADRLCPNPCPHWMADVVADDLVRNSLLLRLDNFLPIDKHRQMLNSRHSDKHLLSATTPTATLKAALVFG
jgi:hypothetical protein